MSASKKRKITTGAVQQVVTREREIMADPSLPADVRDLLAKQERALELKEAELLQYKKSYDEATSNSPKAATEVNFHHGTMPEDTPRSETRTFLSWRDLPLQIRCDPHRLVQAIRDKDNHFERWRFDIPREVLMQHRIVALEACKAGILSGQHDVFLPKREEWLHDQVLSRFALERGLIKCMSEAPMLTVEDVIDLLRKRTGSWERMVPGDLKRNEGFCQRALQLGSPYLAWNVFEAFPSLTQKWQSWKNICSSYTDIDIDIDHDGTGDWSPFVQMVEDCKPPPCFLSYDKFMDMLYNAEPLALKFADSVALTHFVQQKIRTEPKHLAYCSEAFLGRSRDFVEEQLIPFCNVLQERDSDIADLLASKLPRNFVEDKAFVVLWARAGLPAVSRPGIPWWDQSQPPVLILAEGMTVRDTLLLTAKHGRHSQWKLDALSLAPHEVQNDLPFIEEMMKYEPSLFAAASEEIRNTSFNLAMMALSRPAFVNCCRRGFAQVAYTEEPRHILSAETLYAWVTRAKHDIDLHDKFMKKFLCVLQCVADRNNHTALQVVTWRLNENEEK